MRVKPQARLLLGVALALAVTAGPDLVGYAFKGSKVTPEVWDAVSASTHVDLAVDLPFQSRSFHRRQVEQYGLYGGSGGEENRLLLRRVDSEGLERLSRYYWIEEISLGE